MADFNAVSNSLRPHHSLSLKKIVQKSYAMPVNRPVNLITSNWRKTRQSQKTNGQTAQQPCLRLLHQVTLVLVGRR